VTYPSTAFADQRTDAQKEAVDFIFHKESTPHSKSPDTPVELKFKHKFSKIRITLKQGTSGLSCLNATATLTGMPTSATVDLVKLINGDTDAITPGAPGTIQANVKSTTAAETVFEAIVPPHSGTAGRELQFSVEGTAYSYPLDNTFDLVYGREYKFDLALKAKGAPVDMHDGLSNCYIVAPGATSVQIPITRAITVGGMSPTATATLVKLWDDNDVIPIVPTTFIDTDADRKFTVTASGNQGNAVIALQIGTTIYWSWHIWVTTLGSNLTNNGFVIMDRNLGATDNTLSMASHGLSYQWGRKDPFPGDQPGTAGWEIRDTFHGINGTSVVVPNNTATIEGAALGVTESIRKPMTFFSEINSTGNWLPYDIRSLWNNGSHHKMVYDPCPDGYRVAWNNNEFIISSLINTAFGGIPNGYYVNGPEYGLSWNNFNLPMFYPRNFVGGQPFPLISAPQIYLANSTTSYTDKSAVVYGFNTVTLGQADRGCGMPVRCVEEWPD
jgi:hypothetical protein